MKKRMIALPLALLLVLSACGSSKPTAKLSSSPDSSPTVQQTPPENTPHPLPVFNGVESPEPTPSEEPALPTDDVTLPSIQSFANY